jgi:hypothetical protein
MKTIRFFLFSIAAMLAIASVAIAELDYVRRPQGWFVLAPPLSKPDHVTGLRYIDEGTPRTRWSAVVIRGYDGRFYDYPNEQLCLAWQAL